MRLESLRELFVTELQDMYDAEQQVMKALPRMAEAASDDRLRSSFDRHLRETAGQVKRLEQVFECLDMKPKAKRCKGMKGLVQEGEELIKGEGDVSTLDASLIGAAQKVEHYEIAAYGTLRAYAKTLGESKAAQLLEQNLDEEKRTDESLSELAMSSVNLEAARAS